MKPKTYLLNSTDLVNTARILEFAQTMAKNDRMGAFILIASSYQELPALLVFDLIDGRVNTTPTPAGVTVTWAGPLAETEEYRHNWRPFSFTVDDPKLEWLESVLSDQSIPHRRMPQDGRNEPRLEVPMERLEKAVEIWYYTIAGKNVRDLPSDDPVFQEGGAAWFEDNIDDDPLHRPILDQKPE